jgi:putative inorganic carbon (hco3(-)) transporter
MNGIGFLLYLVFMSSWFLHLTARMPALGAVRFDMLLIVAMVALHFISGETKSLSSNLCFRRLLFLMIAIIVATPFAEWPGSVLSSGIPNFIKSVMFFFFTIWFLTNESRVKIFVQAFVVCQSIRVLEPLYLHMTEGYWGSMASMADWEYMARLSGAPYDVINPNGLAFVVLTILPFIIVLFRENIFWQIIGLSVGPASIYVLYLTGSRSGVIAFLVLILIFLKQSKKKVLIASALVIAGSVAIANIQGNFQDRYLSIFDSDSKNTITSQGRITGVIDDFKVGLRRPLFGHGLGTSAEANANFGNKDQISHNIYTETFQEIGIVGLYYLLMYIWAILKSNSRLYSQGSGYMAGIGRAVFIFSGMNAFFGLASYGLSSYEWYLLGGLSVVIHENLEQNNRPRREKRGIMHSVSNNWT